MKRLVRIAVLMSVAWALVAFVPGLAFAEENKAVVDADHAFVQALGKSDKAAAGNLLDADFTWTNTQGKTVGKSAALADLTGLASANPTGAEVKEITFGEVGEITAVSGKTHVLRVWVKQPAGWRLLVSHAATLAPEGHLGTAAKHGTECVNPCKTIPYKAKNAAERGVIASWQALETAVTNHESQNWGPHVADEFMLVSSGNDHPLDKKNRMDILDKQKKEGTSSAPAPLVSARMFDFGNTVVMTSLHQAPGGKPTHVTRIWINREGRWQLAYSLQTTVQTAGGKGSKS
ncbi:MAG TPA: nuclear transport factor 2 family protein [Terriglobales bacterium]